MLHFTTIDNCLIPYPYPTPYPHSTPLTIIQILALTLNRKSILIRRSVSKWVIFRFTFVDSSARRSWDNTFSFSPLFFFFCCLSTKRIAGGGVSVNQMHTWSISHLATLPAGQSLSHPVTWSQSISQLTDQSVGHQVWIIRKMML